MWTLLGEPVLRTTIRPPLDLLHDDRSVYSGTATDPVQLDTPTFHVATNALRRIVAVQSSYGESIPIEVRQIREHISAGSASPCANSRGS